VQIRRESGRPPALVVADEHADAPGLAKARDCERGRCGVPGGRAQLRGDRLELSSRPAAEERERDVQVLRCDHADAITRSEGAELPARQLVDGIVGQTQGTEETQALTTLDASSGIHTEPSRPCDQKTTQ